MKKLNRFLIFTMCVLLFTGCGKMTGTEEGPFVYYLNKDATSIAAVPVNITGDAVCTTIVCHQEGSLNRDVFNKD